MTVIIISFFLENPIPFRDTEEGPRERVENVLK